MPYDRAPSLEFAGTVDPSHLSSSELSGDVLLIEVEDQNEHDWRALADLPIPVILLLDSADSAPVSSALRAGIRGAISWDATTEEIEGAVHAVNAGLVVTTPASLAELLPDAQPFAEELAEPLSDRELEVLDLLAEGLSNKLIAHRAQHFGAHRQDPRRIYLRETRRLQPDRGGLASDPAGLGDAVTSGAAGSPLRSNTSPIYA